MKPLAFLGQTATDKAENDAIQRWVEVRKGVAASPFAKTPAAPVIARQGNGMGRTDDDSTAATPFLTWIGLACFVVVSIFLSVYGGGK